MLEHGENGYKIIAQVEQFDVSLTHIVKTIGIVFFFRAKT